MHLDRLRCWLEGSLSQEDALQVEAWLEENPSGLAQLEELAGVKEFTADHLVTTLDGIPRSQPPPETVARLKAAEFLFSNDEDAGYALLDTAPKAGVPGRLGMFEIHGLLAAGGMGFVFDGRDPRLQRQVAIKMPAPHLSGDASARSRFMAEAQAVAALDHPHIVPIHSVHEHSGTVFFVMPKVDGLTLEQQVAQHGPLNATEANRVALHAARGLAEAHAKGIVHRDIKPANLLMGHDRVRITDFGIAQPVGYLGAASGTPEFMAPEQKAGTAVTPQSDLYSLGATLAFALAPAAPGSLISRLLSPDPNQRPSAIEVVRLLEAQGAGPRWKHLFLRAATVGAGTALLAIVTTQLPQTANLWNRVLLSPEQAFVVEDKFGVHASLADAINAAPLKGVITIHHDGPWALQDVIISAKHTLTVRPAEGFRPRFTVETGGGAGISNAGHLTLERLTLSRTSSGDEQHGLIEATGGILTLRHCEIRVEAPSRRDAAVPCAVRVNENAALHLDRSALIGSWATPIEIRTTSPSRPTLDLRHSALIGLPVILMRCAEGSVVGLSGENCSLPSPILFADSLATPMPRVNASFTRCLLRAESALWWTPGEATSVLQSHLRWEGVENVFDQDAAFLTSAPRSTIRKIPALAQDLPAWQSFPSVQERDSVTANPAAARRVEAGLRQRPITSLNHEELEALAAPWKQLFPRVGADFPTLWP